MEKRNPKPSRRCQGELIFTASNCHTNSSQNGASPEKAAKKLRTSLQPQPSPPPQQQQQQRANTSPWHPRRVSAPPGGLSCFERPNSRVPPSQFYSPSRCVTPSKPSLSLHAAGEGLLPHTPATSQQKCPLPMSTKKIKQRAAIKLKAFENERLEASRYEQDRSAASLEAQEKAYVAWLNYVLLQPMAAKHNALDFESETSSITSNESRCSSYSDLSHISSDSVLNIGDKLSAFDVSASPTGKKMQRPDKVNSHPLSSIGKPGKEGPSLDAGFQAICSIPILRSRLDAFLDARSRDEVISILIKVAKHIDDGRIRMKDGCTLLSDVALKEKFIQTMLSYNTPWLKIGLHVVLGHNALVIQETLESMPEDPSRWDAEKETQQEFLRLLIEKHFLSHPGLAKYHATNKRIEGLYKQGYHEALSRVVLKRILLLVLTLDKAKCQSTLPLACGIDGIDGGSPILFHKNGKIKSSRHALQEFLLNSMHGEGDVVGHLGVLGYHVTHVQAGLADYSFETRNLLEDLKDGVRLCRLVQVLLADPSLLGKIKIPSDRPRRQNYNCSIALERLARARVSVVDGYGCPIMADDLVDGYGEKVIQLLWNIMLHLQLPALVNSQRLHQEIIRISSCDLDTDGLDGLSIISLLLMWAQAACMKFEFRVQNLASSFSDGQALCYLISFYRPVLLPKAAIQAYKPNSISLSPFSSHIKASSDKNTEILREVAAHNLALFQLAISTLGSIPQVLQMSDLMENDPFVCEHSVIIMLGFLYCRLVEDSPKLEEKMAALHWNAGLELPSKDSSLLPGCSNGAEKGYLGGMIKDVAQQQQIFIRAAVRIQAAVRKWLKSTSQKVQQNEGGTVTQAHLGGWIVRHGNGLIGSHAGQTPSDQEQASLWIQHSWRLHHARKLNQSKESQLLFTICKIQAWWRKHLCRQYFIQIKAAAVLVQSHYRSTREARRYSIVKKAVVKLQALVKGGLARQQYWKYKHASTIIQSNWRCALSRRSCLKQKHKAAKKIQSHWRRFSKRRRYARGKNAAILLQRSWREISASRILSKKMVESATRLQLQWRSYCSRRNFVNKRAAAFIIQKQWREYVWIRLQEEAALKIQSHWRKHCVRRRYARTRVAIALIQHNMWGYSERKKYVILKENVTKLQALVRAKQQRKRRQTVLRSVRIIQSCWRRYATKRETERRQAEVQCAAAIKLQSSWRRFSSRKSFLALSASTVKIQSYVRSYICRKSHSRLKESVIRMQALVRRRLAIRKYQRTVLRSVRIIQSCWRRYATKREIERRQAEAQCAAIKLQASWRRFSTRKSFLALSASTVKIQSYVRGYICRKNHCRRKESVIRMQSLVRRRLAMIKTQRTIQNLIKIQALYRGRRQLRNYETYRNSIRKLQALVRGKRERNKFVMSKDAATIIQKQFREYMNFTLLLKARESVSAMRIQHAWRFIQSRKAATVIQAYYRGWRQKRFYLLQIQKITWLQAKVKGNLVRRHLLLEMALVPPSSAPSVIHELSEEASLNSGQTSLREQRQASLSTSAVRLQRWWRKTLNEQHNAATTIQKYFRCWLASRAFTKARENIIYIQAVWRGFQTRHKHDHLKEELSALRKRMQSTAANVDKTMRLEYRLTEALAALLSQKTVSGILHTCATIDLATQHSKLCCERLLEAGAIPKLLQLIQTTNRSPPHEEILKHSLSILGNLARYPSLAPLVVNAPGSLTIVAEQILRNNEQVLAKIIRLLQLLSKVPCGPDALRRNPVVIKRLHNFSQVLEKKVEMETRALARLPHNGTSSTARRLVEKRVNEAVSQHRGVVMILQRATGEDLQTRLKAVKRLSCIHMSSSSAAAAAAAMLRHPRLSGSMAPSRPLPPPPPPPRNFDIRIPLQDCSNI